VAGSIRTRIVILVGLVGLAIAVTGTIVALQQPGASASSGLYSGPPESPDATSPATRVTSWRLLSTNADGTELTIAVGMGGTCEKFDHIDVTESDSSVTITPILVTNLAGACADSLMSFEQKVVLQNPVGTRDLIHGLQLP
jgi:hypothetical protein